MHDSVIEDVLRAVKDHRDEKLQMLLCYASVAATWFLALGAAGYLPKFKVIEDLLSFQSCPCAEQIGEALAFWVAEVVVDSLLDELAPITRSDACLTPLSWIVGVLTMSTLILHLTLAPCGGHHLFVLSAVQTLIGTVMGRTIDSTLWACMAFFSSFVIGAACACGFVPESPQDVSPTASYGFLFSSALSTLVYELAQNSSPCVAITLSRLVELWAHTTAVQHFGTPLAWALYDVMSWIFFFCCKVAVDTIVLWILTSSS